MEAVQALYSGHDAALSEAILADLSRHVFESPEVSPAGPVQCFLARLSLRLLKATTREESRTDAVGETLSVYQNRLLEKSAHSYARALLNSAAAGNAALVEGGDPMNGPYLMLAPAIRKNGDRWDRIFFNSVQGKDVQLRFILETRATFEAATALLREGRSVRVKAVAAGTGLSLILVHDRLIREGADPARITVLITDRDPANTAKTKHLLARLPTTRDHRFTCPNGFGIAARTEDIFQQSTVAGESSDAGFDVVTAVGILEYFAGTDSGTTWERLGLSASPGGPSASDLAQRLAAITAPGGQLLVNTYRDHPSIRILELFGKRFIFRDRSRLAELLAPHGFTAHRSLGSGNIYDMEIFLKYHPADP